MTSTHRRQDEETSEFEGVDLDALHAAATTEPMPLLDIEGVARWLGTTSRHVQRMVAEKRLPHLKVGHFVRFDPRDVTGWLEQQKVQIASVPEYRSVIISAERQLAPAAPPTRRPASAAEVLARWQTRSR